MEFWICHLREKTHPLAYFCQGSRHDCWAGQTLDYNKWYPCTVFHWHLLSWIDVLNVGHIWTPKTLWRCPASIRILVDSGLLPFLRLWSTFLPATMQCTEQTWGLTFGMAGLFLSSACSVNPFFRSEVGIKGGLLSLHTHVTSCLTSLYATWGPSYHVGKVPRREAESHKSGALLLEGLDKNVEAMSRLWLPTRSKQKEVNPHKLL